jgi:putative CocE/NonD family hydrolase
MKSRCAVLVLAGILLAPGLAAQGVPDSLYTITDAMVPMRDGVKLFIEIASPNAISGGPFPIILTRTPYSATGGYHNNLLTELAAERYIFVSADIRGRYKSQGAFLMNRPARLPGDTTGTDESTDTWDTIDWMIHHIANNNGRVGVTGTSYPGWLTEMAEVHPHPALKAAAPMAPMTDTWLGDDFFHNGAFRMTYGLEYSTLLESGNENTNFDVGSDDMFDWYTRHWPLSVISDSMLHGKFPTWASFVAHPAYDQYWQRRAAERVLTHTTVPTLAVGGWWDQEDFFGPLEIYKTLEPSDSAHLNFIALGPWNHGGWHGTGSSLGAIEFGQPTSVWFRTHILVPFFNHYLKGTDALPLAEAVTFEAGDNRWRYWDSWPPKDGEAKALYFHADGKLSFDPPAERAPSAFDSYVSDPKHPVPYRRRPISPVYSPKGSEWYTWLVADQRFVDGRPDVLTWETDPLTDDVTIAGNVTARLFAATTGSDVDWVVKLIDVYPDTVPGKPTMGHYELMVADDIFRGRYRTSYEHPQAITPNAVLPYTIDLHQQNYRFLKGHRIMVQVQSTWFPLYDRNPQTFVPNIFLAKKSDFRAATERIYRSATQASRVEVEVVK